MSVEFDWQVSEDEFEENEYHQRSTPPWMRWGGMLVLLAVIGAVGGGLWWRVYSAELQLRRSAQFILDFEHDAYIDGDGDLLFSVYDPDDLTFQSVQLRPDQQAVHAAGVEVTHAELHNDTIWANTEWQQDETTYQRINFFQQTENGLLHIANDPNYWGEWRETPFDWGNLRLRSADSQWAKEIGERVSLVLNRAGPTRENETQLTVVIREDFDVSTLPNVINYPSPRLLGLDEDGELADRYLTGLEHSIDNYFRPITIRFGVPHRASIEPLTGHLKRFAADFSKQYEPRQISVEFVTVDAASDAAVDWLPTVDAALWTPTEQLIKQGHLIDLTDFASGDAAFDHGDFYEQAWRSAWWDNRMWMVPWATSFNLIYYDRQPFRDMSLDQPDADWSWNELNAALNQLASVDLDKRPFIDPTRDTVYAYALAQDTRCLNRDDCVPELTEDGILAALRWYRELAGESGVAVDLSSVPVNQQLAATLKALSAHKDVSVWIDSPIWYEYQLGLQTTAIVPQMPISAETPLVLPVRVTGMVLSQATEHPYWAWQWVNFLSHQTPPSDLRRHVPARPSVVRQSQFWAWLPEQLAGPMQAALPYSRPILIGEERYLTWEMLARAVQAESVNAISAEPEPIRWFSP